MPFALASLAVLIPGTKAKALDEAGSLGFRLIGDVKRSVQYRIEMGRLLVGALQNAICPSSRDDRRVEKAARSILGAMNRKPPPGKVGLADRVKTLMRGPAPAPAQIMRGTTYLIRITDWVASTGDDEDALEALRVVRCDGKPRTIPEVADDFAMSFCNELDRDPDSKWRAVLIDAIEDGERRAERVVRLSEQAVGVRIARGITAGIATAVGVGAGAEAVADLLRHVHSVSTLEDALAALTAGTLAVWVTRGASVQDQVGTRIAIEVAYEWFASVTLECSDLTTPLPPEVRDRLILNLVPAMVAAQRDRNETLVTLLLSTGRLLVRESDCAAPANHILAESDFKSLRLYVRDELAKTLAPGGNHPGDKTRSTHEEESQGGRNNLTQEVSRSEKVALPLRVGIPEARQLNERDP